MKNDRILQKWEGETYLSSIVFSENNKFAGICRKISYTNNPNVDRLVIFDLLKKRTTHDADFTCSGTALAVSSDGDKLTAEHRYLSDSINLITRVTTLNTTPPYERKYFDFDSWFYPYAVTLSPDGSMLAAGCSKNEICFLDPSDGREIYRLKAHSKITSLAFSKDGSVLAASSNWGLISVWAIPPFTSNEGKTESSNIYQFPLCIPGDQIVNYQGAYSFEIAPIKNSDFYLWGFFQNSKSVWGYQGDTPSSYKYTIPAVSEAHSKFSAGSVEIWVRGNIKGLWTDPVIMTVCLSSDAPTSTPLPTDTPTLTSTAMPTAIPTETPTAVPTVDLSHAAFATGWENGQLEGFGNLILDSQNIVGYFNSSDPPPEAGSRPLEDWATPKMAPNGRSYYLMVAGYSQAPSSHIYFKLFDTNIKIEKGMKLRYWIYTFEGKTFAIDGHFTNGTTIREFNNNGYLKDQNGNRIHPAFQGVYDTGYWRSVEVDLSRAAGQTLDYLMVSFDNGDSGLTGSIRAYIDNLSISP
jgi:hypothetical protein